MALSSSLYNESFSYLAMQSVVIFFYNIALVFPWFIIYSFYVSIESSEMAGFKSVTVR